MAGLGEEGKSINGLIISGGNAPERFLFTANKHEKTVNKKYVVIPEILWDGEKGNVRLY